MSSPTIRDKILGFIPPILKQKKKKVNSSPFSFPPDPPILLGSYTVHIYITQTTRVIIPQGDFDGILRVESLDETKWSRVRPSITGNDSTFWHESFFFEKVFESKNELLRAKFDISIRNHRLSARIFNEKGFLKSNLIGGTSGTLFAINQSKTHALVNNWGVLTNPAEDPTKIFGFALYSISFTHHSQRKANLESISRGLGGLIKTPIEIPPNVRLEFKQLSVIVFKGKDIGVRGLWVRSDPMLRLELGSSKVQTRGHRDFQTVEFNEKLLVAVGVPSVHETFQLKLFDESLVSTRLIGTHEFHLGELESSDRKFEFPVWVPFYGAFARKNFGSRDRAAREMRRSYESASEYVGSLLLQIRLEKTEAAVEDTVSANRKEVIDSRKLVAVEARVLLDVVYVYGLFAEGKKARVILSWLEDEFKSEEFPVENGVILCMHTFNITKSFSIDERNLQKAAINYIPPVVLTVEVEGKPFGFLKLEAASHGLSLGGKKTPRLFEASLRLEKSKADRLVRRGGTAGLRVSFDIETKAEPALLGWRSLTKPVVHRGMLVVELYRARGLVAGSGLPSPVVQVYQFGSLGRSKAVGETLTPLWNQRLVLAANFFDFGPGEGLRVPELLVSLWDRPSGNKEPTKTSESIQENVNLNEEEGDVGWGGGVEFLGGVSLPLGPATFAADIPSALGPLQPEWHPLTSNDPHRHSGKLLLGVRLIPEALLATLGHLESSLRSIRAPLQPPSTLYHIKISILGLRGLRGTSPFGIQRAELRIQTSSIQKGRSPLSPSPSFPLMAHAREPGESPGIGCVFTFSATLPVELSLLPGLTGEVYDQGALLKTSRSFLGAFELDLGKFAAITRLGLVEKLMVILKARKVFLREAEKGVVISHTETITEYPVITTQYDRAPLYVHSREETLWVRQGNPELTPLTTQPLNTSTPQPLNTLTPQYFSLQPFTSSVDIPLSAPIDSCFDEAPRDTILRQILSSNPQLAQQLEEQETTNHVLHISDEASPILNIYASGNIDLGDISFQRRVIQQIESLIQFLFATVDLNESLLSPPELRFLHDLKTRTNPSRPQPLNPQPLNLSPLNPSASSVKKQHWFYRLFSRRTPQPQPTKPRPLNPSPPQPFPTDPLRVVISASYAEILIDGTPQLREVTSVDSQLYYSYGYRSKTVNTKQYRLFIDSELEKSPFMSPNLFNSLPIQKGNPPSDTGLLKGTIRVLDDSTFQRLSVLELSKAEREAFQLPPNGSTAQPLNPSFQDRAMMSEVQVSIFVYVLNAELYDSFSFPANPSLFLSVSLSDKSFQTETIPFKSSPNFHKVFRFDTQFPGSGELRLSLFGSSPLLPPRKIGSTSVDIETRFFDPIWLSFPHKPIEKRPLRHKSSKVSIGNLRVWVDIVPVFQLVSQLYFPISIALPPPTKLQIRCVVWEVNGVPLVDSEGAVDIFVLVSFGFESQKTDTHFRSKTGYGSFNFRTVFELQLDEYTNPSDLQLGFRVFDRDFFSENDFVSGGFLDIRNCVFQAAAMDSKQTFLGPSPRGEPGSPRFILEAAFNPKSELREKYGAKNRVQLLVSVDVLPVEDAVFFPVGRGRNEPNRDPFLPKPRKRKIGIGVNVFGILENLLGPEYKTLLSVGCIGVYFLSVVVIFLPVFLAVIASMAITRTIV